MGTNTKEDFFTEENLCLDLRQTHISPSGRYELVVDWYGTKKGCWKYTRGRIYRKGETCTVADVKRNYSSFPFMWLENHVDGHSYLVCGKDYQGQTFVQMDTGKVFDGTSEGSEAGLGFCWGECKLLSPSLLLVEGCYWAAPWEYRVFDISKPEKGWPEYKLPDAAPFLDIEGEVGLDERGRLVWTEYELMDRQTKEYFNDLESEWQKAHTELNKAKFLGVSEDEIARLQREVDALYVEEDDNPGRWIKVVRHQLTFWFGSKHRLVLYEEYKSSRLSRWEKQVEEAETKRKETVRRYKNTCPIYRAVKNKVEGEVWVQYPSLQSRWEGETNPFFLVFEFAKTDTRKATLKWGVESGPLILECWERGVGTTKSEYERSVTGIDDAIQDGWGFV